MGFRKLKMGFGTLVSLWGSALVDSMGYWDQPGAMFSDYFIRL